MPQGKAGLGKVGLSPLNWPIVIGGYLLGSLLPAEWVVRRQKGRTPHELGDNPGGAGTWRLVGPKWAIPVILFDIAKGMVPVAVADRLGLSGGWLVLAAVAPVAGHNWPFYKRFRGGRGLGAATGALFWLALPQMLPAYALGALIAWWRRWVPMVGIVAFPLGLALMTRAQLPPERVQAALAVMLAVAARQVPWALGRLRLQKQARPAA